MTKDIICIVCPKGCQIKVNIDENGNITTTGNTCKRGEVYAMAECTNPVRVITTTVVAQNGKVIPVKTTTAVAKESVVDCMKAINNIHPTIEQCKFGNIICQNILNTGADIIITAPIR